MERLKIPIHHADLSAIQASFMQAIRGIKKEVGTDVAASQKLTANSAEKIYAELAKGQDEPNRKITVEEVGAAVTQTVSHLPGVDPEKLMQHILICRRVAQSQPKSLR